MKEKVIEYFYFVRDIPYKIPTAFGEPDYCCSGKHEILFDLLKSSNLKVRYGVCLFLWSSLNLPPKVKKIPHEDDCTHTYLEIKIKGEWKILDATWDKDLKKVFQVNKWDGRADTKIAVEPIKIFSPKKSKKIVKNQTEEKTIRRDLSVNGKFYKSFNNWLEEIRGKVIKVF